MDDIKKAAKKELDTKDVIRNQNVAKISAELDRSGKLINDVVGEGESFAPKPAPQQNPVAPVSPAPQPAQPAQQIQPVQPVKKPKSSSRMPILPLVLSLIAILSALGIGIFSFLQLEALQSEITALNKSAITSEKSPAELSADKGNYTDLAADTATIETLSAKNITATESVTLPTAGSASIVALDGACSTPTVSLDGDAASGIISVKTGNSCNGTALARISFSESSTAIKAITVTPNSEAAGTQHFYVNKAEKSFDIVLNSTTKANTNYSFNYSATR